MELQRYAAVRQRIDINFVLPHLDRAETECYVRSHLRYAAGREDIFTDKAFDELHKESTGISRSINRIAEKSLMYSAQQSKRLIDEHMVRYVVEHSFFLLNQKARYEELLGRDGTHLEDVERIALFYLISGNGDLYGKCSYIYDFRNHWIRDCLSEREVDFSSGCKSLIRLGFNLYNGYDGEGTSPYSLLRCLDSENQRLAMNAMAIRFGIY